MWKRFEGLRDEILYRNLMLSFFKNLGRWFRERVKKISGLGFNNPWFNALSHDIPPFDKNGGMLNRYEYN